LQHIEKGSKNADNMKNVYKKLELQKSIHLYKMEIIPSSANTLIPYLNIEHFCIITFGNSSWLLN